MIVYGFFRRFLPRPLAFLLAALAYAALLALIIINISQIGADPRYARL